MRPILLILASALCAGSMSAQSQARLLWSDEFEGSGLPDASKWNYETGGNGWGNNELQFYTKARAENARVENGNLVITARKEDFQDRKYTSARLVTKGKQTWTYGYFEVRAKLPRGRGSWPAIWMLGTGWEGEKKSWPGIGEIDIMEHVGFDPGRVHASIHCTAFNHVAGTQKTATTMVPDAMDGFHVYGLNWTPEFIEVLVDGKSYFHFDNMKKTRAEWPFDTPFYLLLNIAVGGNWGGKEGVDDSIWPQSMLVDYVRVYDRKP